MNSPFTDFMGKPNSTSRYKYEEEIEQKSPFLKFVDQETIYESESDALSTMDEINDDNEMDDMEAEGQGNVSYETVMDESEQLENEWNEEEFYPIYNREGDLEQHVFFSEIEEGLTPELLEGELTKDKLKKAKAANLKYAASEKWESRLPEICKLIGVSPISDVTGIDDDFMNAVAAWQQSGIDGIIGPGTWKKMQLTIQLIQNPLSPSVETTPALKTFFVSIPHGAEGKAAAQTAIFIPQGTDKSKTSINLIIYLHGHKVASGLKENSTIQDFLTHKSFLLREELNKTDKNVILVAPTLGPLSEAGLLAEHPGFFDAYIDKIAELLQDQFYEKKKVSINSIILSAHSGGGKPMLNILRMISSKYVPKINECWGFDSLYQLSVSDYIKFSWKDWLKDSTKTFFNFSVSKLKREGCLGKKIDAAPGPWLNAQSLKSSALPNYKAEDSVVCHNTVPTHYLKVRLDSPSSPLPKR